MRIIIGYLLLMSSSLISRGDRNYSQLLVSEVNSLKNLTSPENGNDSDCGGNWKSSEDFLRIVGKPIRIVNGLRTDVKNVEKHRKLDANYLTDCEGSEEIYDYNWWRLATDNRNSFLPPRCNNRTPDSMKFNQTSIHGADKIIFEISTKIGRIDNVTRNARRKREALTHLKSPIVKWSYSLKEDNAMPCNVSDEASTVQDRYEDSSTRLSRPVKIYTKSPVSDSHNASQSDRTYLECQDGGNKFHDVGNSEVMVEYKPPNLNNFSGAIKKIMSYASNSPKILQKFLTKATPSENGISNTVAFEDNSVASCTQKIIIEVKNELKGNVSPTAKSVSCEHRSNDVLLPRISDAFNFSVGEVEIKLKEKKDHDSLGAQVRRLRSVQAQAIPAMSKRFHLMHGIYSENEEAMMLALKKAQEQAQSIAAEFGPSAMDSAESAAISDFRHARRISDCQYVEPKLAGYFPFKTQPRKRKITVNTTGRMQDGNSNLLQQYADLLASLQERIEKKRMELNKLQETYKEDQNLLEVIRNEMIADVGHTETKPLSDLNDNILLDNSNGTLGLNVSPDAVIEIESEDYHGPPWNKRKSKEKFNKFRSKRFSSYPVFVYPKSLHENYNSNHGVTSYAVSDEVKRRRRWTNPGRVKLKRYRPNETMNNFTFNLDRDEAERRLSKRWLVEKYRVAPPKSETLLLQDLSNGLAAKEFLNVVNGTQSRDDYDRKLTKIYNKLFSLENEIFGGQRISPKCKKKTHGSGNVTVNVNVCVEVYNNTDDKDYAKQCIEPLALSKKDTTSIMVNDNKDDENPAECDCDWMNKNDCINTGGPTIV